MENLLLSIPAYSISNKAPATVSEGSIFTFRIKANEITDLTEEVILHFSGTDKNNNQIISFSPNYAQQCVSIPTRISNTGWTDPNTPDLTYGDDEIHRFKFSCAPQGGLPPGIASNEETEVIIEGYEILLDETLTHPTNSGNCKDGAIDLKIAGGISPYDVTWYRVNDNGQNEEIKNAVSETGNDGAEDVSNLIPGKYLVEVKDALCGIVSQEYELTNCACIAVNKVYQKNVSKCGNNLNSGAPYESCDGELEIEVIGTDQYKVEWSNGATELEINYLCVGTYIVTVTIEGCDPIINTYEICCCNNETAVDEPYPMCDMPAQINITGADITSPSSSTATDGAIDIHVEGGNGATYKWTGPNGFTANTEDISGLTIGTYCVTITNECGGIIGNCYTLVDCSGVNINIQGTVENACDGYNIGKISLTVSGGNTPYKYKWSNGAFSKNLENLSPGSYCVTVTDFNGCRNVKCFQILSTPIQVVRNECTYYYMCNGKVINTYDIGRFYEFSSTDCRYINWYCNDGKFLYKQYVGSYFNVDKYQCVAYEYCYNGKLYNTYRGQKGSSGASGYDSANDCWYCFTYDYCYFNDNLYYIYNVYSHLGISESPIDYTYNYGCDMCYIKIYCGSTVMAEGSDCCGSQSDCLRPNIVPVVKKNTGEDIKFYDFSGEIVDYAYVDRILKESGQIDTSSVLLNLIEKPDSLLLYDLLDSRLEQNLKNLTESNPEVNIYPNPFNDYLNFEVNNLMESNINIKIFNLLNQEIYSNKWDYSKENNTLRINLSHLNAGFYIINVSNTKELKKSYKFVKQ